MLTLNRGQRDTIRKYYNLNERTLKITNEILYNIYEEEMGKAKYLKLLDERFYNMKNEKPNNKNL